MARVFTVDKSRKGHECGRCGDKIPVGGTYRWLKPRYGSKKIRCTKPTCKFMPSDMSSAKTAYIYDAIIRAEEALDAAATHDDMQAVLADVAEQAREVASEYQEASDAWAGGNGNEEFTEKVDECESYADSLDSWEFSGEHDEDAVRNDAVVDDEPAETYEARLEAEQDAQWEQRLEEMRDEARDALNEFSL